MMTALLVWMLEGQRYALPLAEVVRVLQAVAVTPLAGVPAAISGVVNVHGQVVPVADMRRRLQLPLREPALTDRLVLINTAAARRLAFLADTVAGVAEYDAADIVPADELIPGAGWIAGIARLPDGLIVIQDFDRFLSLDEVRALEQAMAAREVE